MTTTGPTIVPNGPVVTTSVGTGPVAIENAALGTGPAWTGEAWRTLQSARPNPPAAGTAKKFIFTLESFEILNTRSRHEDTDYVSFTLAIGNGAPQTQTKAMGNLNNGTFAVGLSFGPVAVDPNEAAIFNYVILNSGHQSQQETQDALTKAGKYLAQLGAAAAAKAIAAGATSLVGASIGTAVLPVIGTALGVIAGWLVDELGGVLFANCDGPVAAEQVAMTGAELATHTANGQIYRHTTSHLGTDSHDGCGSNSIYNVTWQIKESH